MELSISNSEFKPYFQRELGVKSEDYRRIEDILWIVSHFNSAGLLHSWSFSLCLVHLLLLFTFYSLSRHNSGHNSSFIRSSARITSPSKYPFSRFTASLSCPRISG